MGSNLTVALIIPTYNRAKLVQEAIASALDQTRVPDEIIVVDDGSTDETWDVLQTYGPPVIPIHQENQGRSAARNAGIAHATADLICFLDSDDVLLPDAIKVRAEYLEAHPEAGVVYAYVERQDMDGNPVKVEGRARPWPSGNIFPILARYNYIPIQAVMIRRDCLPAPPYFDLELGSSEDTDFMVRLSANHPFAYIEEKISVYRYHEQMTMAKFGKLLGTHFAVQDRVYDMDAYKTLPSSLQARIACSHAITRLRYGKAGRARERLRRAMRAAPLYLPAYGIWALSWFGYRPVGILTELYKGLKKR